MFSSRLFVYYILCYVWVFVLCRDFKEVTYLLMLVAANDFILIQRNWECPYARSRSWAIVVLFTGAVL